MSLLGENRVAQTLDSSDFTQVALEIEAAVRIVEKSHDGTVSIYTSNDNVKINCKQNSDVLKNEMHYRFSRTKFDISCNHLLNRLNNPRCKLGAHHGTPKG